MSRQAGDSQGAKRCVRVCVWQTDKVRERGGERAVNTLVQLTLSPSWNGIGNEDGHRMGLGMGTRLGMGEFLRI